MSDLDFWASKRAVSLAAENELPVKQHLREKAITLRTRIQNGLAALDRWEEWDLAKREASARLLGALLQCLVETTSNAHRALPTTSIAICSNCQRVTLPFSIDGGSYRCPCGWLWFNHRSSNFQHLPPEFWAHTMPGDIAPKKLLSDEQQDKGDAA